MSADMTVYDAVIRSVYGDLWQKRLDDELNDLRWLNQWWYATRRTGQIAWWMAAGAMPWVKR